MASYNVTLDSTTTTLDSRSWTLDQDPYALADPVTRTADWYVGKVTPWQAKPVKARFLATMRIDTQIYADGQALIASLPAAFDLDFAEGAQLDVCGQWIGLSRFVPVPLPTNYLSLGIPGRGLGQAPWKGPYDTAEGLSQLPDTLYRKLLRAKIAANYWDGTAAGAAAVLRVYFDDSETKLYVHFNEIAVAPIIPLSLGVPSRGLGQGVWRRKRFALGIKGQGLGQGQLFRRDAQPENPPDLGLEMVVGVAGKQPSAIDLAILGTGLIPVKPMGARLRVLVTTVDTKPLFGLGPQTDRVAGLGVGAWGNTPAIAAAQQLAA